MQERVRGEGPSLAISLLDDGISGNGNSGNGCSSGQSLLFSVSGRSGKLQSILVNAPYNIITAHFPLLKALYYTNPYTLSALQIAGALLSAGVAGNGNDNDKQQRQPQRGGGGLCSQFISTEHMTDVCAQALEYSRLRDFLMLCAFYYPSLKVVEMGVSVGDDEEQERELEQEHEHDENQERETQEALCAVEQLVDRLRTALLDARSCVNVTATAATNSGDPLIRPPISVPVNGEQGQAQGQGHIQGSSNNNSNSRLSAFSQPILDIWLRGLWEMGSILSPSLSLKSREVESDTEAEAESRAQCEELTSRIASLSCTVPTTAATITSPSPFPSSAASITQRHDTRLLIDIKTYLTQQIHRTATATNNITATVKKSKDREREKSFCLPMMSRKDMAELLLSEATVTLPVPTHVPEHVPVHVCASELEAAETMPVLIYVHIAHLWSILCLSQALGCAVVSLACTTKLCKVALAHVTDTAASASASASATATTFSASASVHSVGMGMGIGMGMDLSAVYKTTIPHIWSFSPIPPNSTATVSTLSLRHHVEQCRRIWYKAASIYDSNIATNNNANDSVGDSDCSHSVVYETLLNQARIQHTQILEYTHTQENKRQQEQSVMTNQDQASNYRCQNKCSGGSDSCSDTSSDEREGEGEHTDGEEENSPVHVGVSVGAWSTAAAMSNEKICATGRRKGSFLFSDTPHVQYQYQSHTPDSDSAHTSMQSTPNITPHQQQKEPQEQLWGERNQDINREHERRMSTEMPTPPRPSVPVPCTPPRYALRALEHDHYNYKYGYTPTNAPTTSPSSLLMDHGRALMNRDNDRDREEAIAVLLNTPSSYLSTVSSRNRVSSSSRSRGSQLLSRASPRTQQQGHVQDSTEWVEAFSSPLSPSSPVPISASTSTLDTSHGMHNSIHSDVYSQSRKEAAYRVRTHRLAKRVGLKRENAEALIRSARLQLVALQAKSAASAASASTSVSPLTSSTRNATANVTARTTETRSGKELLQKQTQMNASTQASVHFTKLQHDEEKVKLIQQQQQRQQQQQQQTEFSVATTATSVAAIAKMEESQAARRRAARRVREHITKGLTLQQKQLLGYASSNSSTATTTVSATTATTATAMGSGMSKPWEVGSPWEKEHLENNEERVIGVHATQWELNTGTDTDTSIVGAAGGSIGVLQEVLLGIVSSPSSSFSLSPAASPSTSPMIHSNRRTRNVKKIEHPHELLLHTHTEERENDVEDIDMDRLFYEHEQPQLNSSSKHIVDTNMQEQLHLPSPVSVPVPVLPTTVYIYVLRAWDLLCDLGFCNPYVVLSWGDLGTCRTQSLCDDHDISSTSTTHTHASSSSSGSGSSSSNNADTSFSFMQYLPFRSPVLTNIPSIELLAALGEDQYVPWLPTAATTSSTTTMPKVPVLSPPLLIQVYNSHISISDELIGEAEVDSITLMSMHCKCRGEHALEVPLYVYHTHTSSSANFVSNTQGGNGNSRGGGQYAGVLELMFSFDQHQ